MKLKKVVVLLLVLLLIFTGPPPKVFAVEEVEGPDSGIADHGGGPNEPGNEPADEPGEKSDEEPTDELGDEPGDVEEKEEKNEEEEEEEEKTEDEAEGEIIAAQAPRAMLAEMPQGRAALPSPLTAGGYTITNDGEGGFLLVNDATSDEYSLEENSLIYVSSGNLQLKLDDVTLKIKKIFVRNGSLTISGSGTLTVDNNSANPSKPVGGLPDTAAVSAKSVYIQAGVSLKATYLTNSFIATAGVSADNFICVDGGTLMGIATSGVKCFGAVEVKNDGEIMGYGDSSQNNLPDQYGVYAWQIDAYSGQIYGTASVSTGFSAGIAVYGNVNVNSEARVSGSGGDYGVAVYSSNALYHTDGEWKRRDGNISVKGGALNGSGSQGGVIMALDFMSEEGWAGAGYDAAFYPGADIGGGTISVSNGGVIYGVAPAYAVYSYGSITVEGKGSLAHGTADSHAGTAAVMTDKGTLSAKNSATIYEYYTAPQESFNSENAAPPYGHGSNMVSCANYLWCDKTTEKGGVPIARPAAQGLLTLANHDGRLLGIRGEAAVGEIVALADSGRHIIDIPAKLSHSGQVCTIIFNLNGGSAVPAQSMLKNYSASEPPTPTRAGYSFGGWYLDADFTTKYNFTGPLTADITLFALWKADSPADPAEPTLPSGSGRERDDANIQHPSGPSAALATPNTTTINDDAIALAGQILDADIVAPAQNMEIAAEYIPAGKLPQTGAAGLNANFAATIVLAICAGCIAKNKKQAQK